MYLRPILATLSQTDKTVVKILAAFAEDLGSVPRTHLTTASGDPKPPSGLCRHQARIWFADMRARHT